jgi:hypothetical protein
MSQFYKTHLAFSRGCFEAIFVKNTPGCLGVNNSCQPYLFGVDEVHVGDSNYEDFYYHLENKCTLPCFLLPKPFK